MAILMAALDREREKANRQIGSGGVDQSVVEDRTAKDASAGASDRRDVVQSSSPDIRDIRRSARVDA